MSADFESEMASDEDDVSMDQVSEDEQGITHRNQKREADGSLIKNKRMKGDAESPSKHRSNLHRPLTVEELNTMRETESLYKSNLFRLQIERQLEAIKVKPKYIRLFEGWFNEFKEFVLNLPQYGEIKLSDLNGPVDGNRDLATSEFINMIQNQYSSCVMSDHDVGIKFIKPEECVTFGLHKINSIIGPQLTVDVNITMPKSCFHEKDYLNNRYVLKREYYLLYIYLELKKTDLSSYVSYLEKNKVLHIKPKVSKMIQVYLHASPAKDAFNLSRFDPDKDNLRGNYFDIYEDKVLIKQESQGTPYYNSLLLQEFTLANNYNFLETALASLFNVQEALKLLLLWLNRRGLCLTYNGFSQNLLSQTILYLTITKKINKHMSSYQVIRAFWVFLSTSDWHETPISICGSVEAVKLDEFRRHFDVVFLDKSGCFNLAAFLYLDVYKKVRREAEMAVRFLDDNKVNSVEALFVQEMSPQTQYDALLRLSDSKGCFRAVYEEINNFPKSKHIGCIRRLIIKRMMYLLKKGLENRVLHIIPLVFNKAYHGTNSRAVEDLEHQPFKSITFGLTLDPSAAFLCLQKGPESSTAEVLTFREFWGDLAETRRFADNSVHDCVYFPAETVQGRRRIFKKVIDFVMLQKLKIHDYSIRADQFERILMNKTYITPFPTGTCEDACLKAKQVFDDLAKILRGFTLPLTIAAVQPAAEVFCFTSAFPPVPTNYRSGGQMTTTKNNCIVLRETTKLGSVPRYVEPLDCVIQLGMHSKWPNDLEALRAVKLAYCLEISTCLQQQNIQSSAKPDYLDVFYEGLVFRFRIYHPKEVSLLKKYTKPDGELAYKDTEESVEIEKRLNIFPKIIGALNGLHIRSSSYGPSTALIKRWLRSHLVDEYHIPDIVISLLNASLHLNPAPYASANLPQVAFLRFLEFLSKFQYKDQYVVINFNDELTKEQIDEFDKSFRDSRSNYPPLFILTCFDDCKSVFSKMCSKEIMGRLIGLAITTYEILKVGLLKPGLTTLVQSLFVPNLEGYNLLIHLKPLMNARRHERFDFQKNDNGVIKLEKYDENESTKVPLVGFNPVDLYVKELWQSYGELALFFYDPYGGNTIGVLFKPNKGKKEFKVTNIAGQKLEDKDLVLNVDAVVQDFYILGEGLVKPVQRFPV